MLSAPKPKFANTPSAVRPAACSGRGCEAARKTGGARLTHGRCAVAVPRLAGFPCSSVLMKVTPSGELLRARLGEAGRCGCRCGRRRCRAPRVHSTRDRARRPPRRSPPDAMRGSSSVASATELPSLALSAQRIAGLHWSNLFQCRPLGFTRWPILVMSRKQIVMKIVLNGGAALSLAFLLAPEPALAQFPPPPSTSAPPEDTPPLVGKPKKKATPSETSITGTWIGQLTQLDWTAYPSRK